MVSVEPKLTTLWLVALTLYALQAGLTVTLKLRLKREVLIAGARTCVQLLLMGFVLREVLVARSLGLPLACLVVMLVAGAQAVAARLEAPSRKLLRKREIGGVLGFEALLAYAIVSLALSSEVGSWLPFIGLAIGNSLSAMALSVERLRQGMQDNRVRIECELAVGASRREALDPVVQQAMRAAMTPILNSLSTAGLVSLPGALSGQLLAGVDATQAVSVQVLIMLSVALLSLLSSWATLRLAFGRLWRGFGFSEAWL